LKNSSFLPDIAPEPTADGAFGSVVMADRFGGALSRRLGANLKNIYEKYNQLLQNCASTFGY
jgi:hypothetical protein